MVLSENSEVDKVEVVAYNPAWPQLFQDEAARLHAILGDEILAVHHIGSTSVPGLRAKPIVDVLVEVRNIQLIDPYNPLFTSLGYIPMGEYGIPGRRFFIKGTMLHRTHHIHIFETGHPEIERHQLFREYLVTHPADRQAYEDLKMELAYRFPYNRPAYQEGKGPLIKEIDAKALAWSTHQQVKAK